MKVHGPYRYTDKSGKDRLLVNIVINGKKTSQSYPRYLMEQHLGRKLDTEEDVDHIDRDPMNNDLSNLRVLPRRENRGMYSSRPPLEFSCGNCGTMVTRARNKMKKIYKLAPCCSRKCSRALQIQAGVAQMARQMI